MQSTMQDFPLSIGMIFRHGRSVFGDSEVVTFEGDASRRVSFTELAERVDLLAAALRRLGVDSGDRVATFAKQVRCSEDEAAAVLVFRDVDEPVSVDRFAIFIGSGLQQIHCDARREPEGIPSFTVDARQLLLHPRGLQCGNREPPSRKRALPEGHPTTTEPAGIVVENPCRRRL